MYRPVPRRLRDGRVVTVWEVQDIRRIPDQLLRSVVFLYPSLEAAVTGAGYGGSGFVVATTTGTLVDREAMAARSEEHTSELQSQ